jgi:hypothetical protein
VPNVRHGVNVELPPNIDRTIQRFTDVIGPPSFVLAKTEKVRA